MHGTVRIFPPSTIEIHFDQPYVYTVQGTVTHNESTLLFDHEKMAPWHKSTSATTHVKVSQLHTTTTTKTAAPTISNNSNIFPLDQQHSIHQAKHGMFVTSLLDPWVGRSLREYGEWSEQELVLFQSILKPGDVAIDAGANIGAFTIPMAKAVGPTGRVFAFEAQRRLHHLLSANIAINNLMNVRNPHVALGETNHSHSTVRVPNVNFTQSGNFGAVSLVDQTYTESQTHAIEKISLDTWFMNQWLLKGTEMENNKGDRMCPAFIKIDVEGMEEQIVRGFTHGIQRCAPILYVENNCLKDSPGLLKLLMETFHYEVAWDLAPYYSPDNYKVSTQDIFQGLMSVNVLALPHSMPEHRKKLLFGRRTRIDPHRSYFLKDYAELVSMQTGKDPAWISTLQTGSMTFCKR